MGGATEEHAIASHVIADVIGQQRWQKLEAIIDLRTGYSYFYSICKIQPQMFYKYLLNNLGIWLAIATESFKKLVNS